MTGAGMEPGEELIQNGRRNLKNCMERESGVESRVLVVSQACPKSELSKEQRSFEFEIDFGN